MNNLTNEFWSKLTWISNISFFDLLTIPSNSPKVLLTEIEESARLLVIFTFLNDIYFDSQVVCSCKESSEIPLRFINTMLDIIAGPEITNED